MKKIDWAFTSVWIIVVVFLVGSGFMIFMDHRAQQRRLHEEWSFVGYAPSGSGIYKRYFSDHGVWIFVTDSSHESISAVPLEIKK